MNTVICILIAVALVFFLSRILKSKPKGYENITSQELNALLKDKKVKLIDVRSKAEMMGGVIGKPEWLELNKNFRTKAAKLDKEKTYVVYCRSGRRSTMASKMMAGLGFKSVFNLSGGYMSYK